MPVVLVGTAEGIRVLGEGAGRVLLPGQGVRSLARGDDGWWALTKGDGIWRGGLDDPWQQVTVSGESRANCISLGPAGLFVGTSEAHLQRLADGALERVESFETVDGRDGWHTPWGGPPDVRSIDQSPSAVFVNVHVGGIPTSDDEGKSWRPTIEIDADVHQVRVDQESELIFAACARGLAVSGDDGRRWSLRTEGLHARYCRAVAVAGEAVLVSSSAGPRGGQAAVYRQPADGSATLERCTQGLPEWFDGNIDTGCLDGRGAVAAFATEGGDVYLSEDAGATWTRVAEGLPRARWVAIA